MNDDRRETQCNEPDKSHIHAPARQEEHIKYMSTTTTVTFNHAHTNTPAHAQRVQIRHVLPSQYTPARE